MHQIVIGDEKWIHYGNPKRKNQMGNWPETSQSNGKAGNP